MQALCGLQGIFDLFNCKTPVFNCTISDILEYVPDKEDKS